MVESAGLEIRCTVLRTVGSNPTLSANRNATLAVAFLLAKRAGTSRTHWFDQRRPGDAAQDARLRAVPRRMAPRDAGIAIRRTRHNPTLRMKLRPLRSHFYWRRGRALREPAGSTSGVRRRRSELLAGYGQQCFRIALCNCQQSPSCPAGLFATLFPTLKCTHRHAK